MSYGQDNMELFTDQRSYPVKFFKFFRARKTDPHTSLKAAEEIKEVAPQHMDLIYNCLLEHGPLGKDGIARLTGLNPNQVARRLPELQKIGMVATTGQTVYSDAGRSEREWSLT
jgi:predicted transcriptional regulator